MSYFQPLITSAFSSYSVSRSVYADRAANVFRNESAEKTTEKQDDVKTVDADAGKPKSVSGDVLDLSDEAQKSYESKVDDKQADTSIKLKEEAKSEETDSLSASAKAPGQTELTPEEEQQVTELKARDQEVRTHEAAHVAAGGPYVTGGPSYTYQTGPDGKQYAIGGEVGIDTSEISGDPKATIQKMQTVAAAATAPAEPSGQDMKVAAAARQKAAQAQAELAAQSNPASNSASNSDSTGETDSSEATQSVQSSKDVAKSEPEGSAPEGSTKISVADSSDADETVANSKPLSSQAFAAGAVKSQRHSSAYQAQSLMSLSTAPKSVFSAFV